VLRRCRGWQGGFVAVRQHEHGIHQLQAKCCAGLMVKLAELPTARRSAVLKRRGLWIVKCTVGCVFIMTRACIQFPINVEPREIGNIKMSITQEHILVLDIHPK